MFTPLVSLTVKPTRYEIVISVRSRQTYLEGGNAYVPEDSLIEFFVTKFRASLSRGLAIASKKAALALNGEEDRLAPIVKTFGNFMNLEADFSSEGGRLTLSNFDAVAKASAPPCTRQMLDALSIDKKLKHDGRLHLWGFLKGKISSYFLRNFRIFQS